MGTNVEHAAVKVVRLEVSVDIKKDSDKSRVGGERENRLEVDDA